MVLEKLPVPGRPTVLIIVGQRPTALAVGAGGGCLDIFTLDYPFSPLSPSLWETARYRLKYYLKGLLNQKQPTKKSNISVSTEDIYLKLRVVVRYQKGTHTSRGGNPPFLSKLCPFFDLKFSKCSYSRALAPACGALVCFVLRCLT